MKVKKRGRASKKVGCAQYIRLEDCFNGRTIKTNRRIESSRDEKANVKFESGKRRGGRATDESPKFLPVARRVDSIFRQHVNFIVSEEGQNVDATSRLVERVKMNICKQSLSNLRATRGPFHEGTK